MTAIADHSPAHHSSVRGEGLGDPRRQAEAVRRRQEALARLAQRRMPLPGQPMPATLSSPETRMSLVSPVPTAEVEAVPCSCAAERTEFPRPALTSREIEVLRTWLRLDSKPAVAEELFISLGTVNTHLTRIRAKYSDVGRAAPTKAGLVARAVQDGLIALDEL